MLEKAIQRKIKDEQRAMAIAKLPHDIRSLDLSMVRRRLIVCRDQPTRLVDRAEQEYRLFLRLARLFPQLTLVPTPLIDVFWEEHLVDTRQYREHCVGLFGLLLEHRPNCGAVEDSYLCGEAQDLTRRLFRSMHSYVPFEYEGEKSKPALCLMRSRRLKCCY